MKGLQLLEGKEFGQFKSSKKEEGEENCLLKILR